MWIAPASRVSEGRPLEELCPSGQHGGRIVQVTEKFLPFKAAPGNPDGKCIEVVFEVTTNTGTFHIESLIGAGQDAILSCLLRSAGVDLQPGDQFDPKQLEGRAATGLVGEFTSQRTGQRRACVRKWVVPRATNSGHRNHKWGAGR